jgi:oxygen-independent coproporphyrinogen-3 oxidase
VAGIYIHIPFCKKRCYYCDFYSSVNTSYISTFSDALKKEIVIRKGFFSSKNPEISTIYFGGGTPSLLSLDILTNIFSDLKENFNVLVDAEITVEVNPDDTSTEYYEMLKRAGFNRVSIGIQSFDDHFLKLMNRRHNATEALMSVEAAQKAGFDNISIDLIYGLSGMTIAMWEANLKIAFSLPIRHLSAYHLGIEEHTVFHRWLEKGKLKPIDEELSFQQFILLNTIAQTSGFEHYEISNLSLPGYRSKHNTSYWQHLPYLGLGPSAHSFDGESRFWNVSDVKLYSDKIGSGSIFWESELLSQKDKTNEFIMTRLRIKEGINIGEFDRLFGNNKLKELICKAQPYLDNNYATIDITALKLTMKGWFLSDKVISDLMFADSEY